MLVIRAPEKWAVGGPDLRPPSLPLPARVRARSGPLREVSWEAAGTVTPLGKHPLRREFCVSRDGNRIPQGQEQLLFCRIPGVAFGHHSRISPVAPPPPTQNVRPDTVKVVRYIFG